MERRNNNEGELQRMKHKLKISLEHTQNIWKRWTKQAEVKVWLSFKFVLIYRPIWCTFIYLNIHICKEQLTTGCWLIIQFCYICHTSRHCSDVLFQDICQVFIKTLLNVIVELVTEAGMLGEKVNMKNNVSTWFK